ncbi:hypothetical protein BJ322DRAFT_1077010 [Thelephora terrestris]|uniref:F-box domain-containing protein n=1 Tax=Thelephora terrestris TaxID=56493 RepID=A0A9P6L3V0_9AGAM|nr:hypothetical protein BJ322DRAFT_1077010 [Thelephora terrestris]
MKYDDLRTLLPFLKNATRSVVVAQNESSPISKLPPRIIITISELVAEPRTRESMFELVKMTHVCQYWRSALISFPHLWSSIFVKNDRKEFVAACLERSQRVPLTVSLHLKYGTYRNYRESPKCTCFQWSSWTRISEENPCSYHTTILPLLHKDHTERIRKLDVRLILVENPDESAHGMFMGALTDLKFFVFPLPLLESLSFDVNPAFESDVDTYMDFRGYPFRWKTSPPASLRHLTLHGCYGGPIPSLQNLTSFELAGVEEFDPIELDKDTFLPFLSRNTSLVSLTLTHCSFPVGSQLPRVTPVELSRLKTLRLADIRESPGFPCLIEIPALKTISSLHISIQKRKDGRYTLTDFRARAQSHDGFQLSIDVPELEDDKLVDDKLISDWVGITRNADPRPALVRFERQDLGSERGSKINFSPLPLFVNAKVLEISASFANRWYLNFQEDLEKIGPQLTTLRLEVVEGMNAGMMAQSVKRFVEARLKKGMPLIRLEKMMFEGMSEEGEANAERLWEEFRASLHIDQYLATL